MCCAFCLLLQQMYNLFMCMYVPGRQELMYCVCTYASVCTFVDVRTCHKCLLQSCQHQEYVHTQTYLHVETHIHLHACTNIHTHMHTHTHTHTHARTHAHTHARTHARTRTHTHTHVNTLIHQTSTHTQYVYSLMSSSMILMRSSSLQLLGLYWWSMVSARPRSLKSTVPRVCCRAEHPQPIVHEMKPWKGRGGEGRGGEGSNLHSQCVRVELHA